VILTAEEKALLQGSGGMGTAMAMRILTSTAEALGADSLIPISSAHIDGCLYHGDSGTLFAERLVEGGARVRVQTTLNVAALDLIHHGRVRLSEHELSMARRLTSAYVALGCTPTWTCAPYQAGHRPAMGTDVAWGESNAVAFCNSVLGARTNRYGDFLDICAAVTARAPYVGLHVPENRLATVLVDTAELDSESLTNDLTFVLIGAWLGGAVNNRVAAFEGLGSPSDDQLKALGAAAASTGAVGLYHVIGSTPEAPTRHAAFGGKEPLETIKLTRSALAAVRSGLSTIDCRPGDPIDAVAIGSPHLSAAELRRVDTFLGDRCCCVKLYACTGRHVLQQLVHSDVIRRLEDRGVEIVTDTCIVVTPVLPEVSGVLVTNSGKFAYYAPSLTGYSVVFASLQDCIESAVEGKLHGSHDEN
jgi:predicted aconitase